MTAPAPVERYDLVVLGSGPAGQKAAIAAAKLGKRVAIADASLDLGGACVHTGTIPSKTLREAILYLTGWLQRGSEGLAHPAPERISIAELSRRILLVVAREVEVIRDQLSRNRVEIVLGHGRFVGPNRVAVELPGGERHIEAEHALIATGSRPAHSATVPVDGERILDSDQLLDPKLADRPLPRSMIVVGAGVIGLEYASMLTALRCEVTVIDARETMLEFVDGEILEALVYHLRASGTVFRLGERVDSVTRADDGRVLANLASGKRVHGDALLYTVGRQGNTEGLGLEAIGLAADARGRLQVDASFRTRCPWVWAAGDVIGFPALASTSMEQGRLAACAMFGAPGNHMPHLHPYGIFTIPEISMVGATEQELTGKSIPYEIGIARFEDLAKGQMSGDRSGMLKLLFNPEGFGLLGVHVIGAGAADLVHIGQTALALGGTIEWFRDAVFNYPTLAEAYKVAALDGFNRL